MNVPASDHEFITIICTHCGHQISVPVYCGDRFCPVCSVPRLSKVKRRLKFLVRNTNPPRGSSFKFLTLTIRNQDDLPTMLHDLTRSFRRLRQRASWKRTVQGGAFVLEVKGHPGNWHAHLHAVIVSYYFPFDKLLRLWKSVSSGQGVYIKRISPSQTINYITKYLTKPSVPDEVRSEIAVNLHSFRLFQPFGCMFKLMKTYIDKKRGCPQCGSHAFMPYDIWYNPITGRYQGG